MDPLRSIPEIPIHGNTPRHVAIIMDGNGRWAQARHLPRFAGHRRGVEAVREAVKACIDRGIGHLTLFAFSSENWRRPKEEVALLMQLFLGALTNEVEKLHRNRVRLKVIGDLSPFDARIRALIASGEELTHNNERLTLTIAANYGGRWDILQAVGRLVRAHKGVLPEVLSEDLLAPHLSMHDAPEPDLFIRTGGEQRVSNFLLWQLAYAELHFTDRLWPDFDTAALDEALASYRQRERRFGRTSGQVLQARNAERDALAPRRPAIDPAD